MKRISEEIHTMLNNQLKNELDSSRLYLAMSEWMEFNGWFGGAKLWRKYSDEELAHMHKFYEYMQDRDAMPKTPMAKEQPLNFDSVEKIVQDSYLHEIQVSTWIKEIALKALQEKDLHTYEFAVKMIGEQTEEEAKVLYWVDRLEMLKSTDTSLFFLDKEFEEAVG